MTRNLPSSFRSARVVPLAALAPADLCLWKTLCRQEPLLRTPFLAPEFAAAAAAAAPVRVCVLDGPAGRGFFPFQYLGRAGRWLGAAGRVGGALSDHFGVVAAPGLAISADQLMAFAGLRLLDVSHLDAGQRARGLAVGSVRTGLAAALGPDYWARLEAAHPKPMAYAANRARKAARELGPLRFTFASTETVEFDRVIAAKKRQYAATGVPDVLDAPAVAILRRLMAGADPGCSAVLSTLHAGDTWLAGHFGLRCHDVLHYWFPAYSAEHAGLSPGHLLMRAMIDAAMATGVARVDMGEGESAFKEIYATERYELYQGQCHRPALGSLIWRAAQSARWRLQRVRGAPSPA